MTYKEESYILDSIKQIKREVHQNNLMLSDICNVVNTYLANHHKENEEDFNRNVLANILSQFLDIGGLQK
jgi:hypothetical protein